MGTNVVLCRPFRDYVAARRGGGLDPLVMPPRHFRAGLLMVPSLRDWVCFDKLPAHSAELENLS